MRYSLQLLAMGALCSTPSFASDFVVPAGETIVYSTVSGPLIVDQFRVEAGGVLRVQGPFVFRLKVKGVMQVDGLIDVSGVDASGVGTINTGNMPELGAPGVCGGGRGGVGSWMLSASTPGGGSGFGAHQVSFGGGFGGESGFGQGLMAAYRGAGGGGGALGPNLPGQAQPGLIGIEAMAGAPGGSAATGAMSGVGTPMGGTAGPGAFVDGLSSNDFWGVKADPVTGTTTIGELMRPRPGSGGGAGGDSIPSASFPNVPWSPASDFKGAGGGGGGGLVVVNARMIRFGQGGAIRIDGGRGGSGESMFGASHVGAGSGGGSGGYLVMQAALIDLSLADGDCLSALGGRGGLGASGGLVGEGGHGGPGVLQLHVKTAANLLLPIGTGLDDLSSPNAHVLLPIL